MGNHNLDKNASVIVIEVLIENKGIKKKLKMVLDTGATYTLIPWQVAEALNMEPALSKTRADIITASGVEKVPLMFVESVAAFDKKAENVKIIVHDLPAKSYVDGLLGLSFLRNFNLHINFKEGYLELT
ncbi:retroviral-like aspartic protease family protein [Candidatus Woesearchaeota archaeon]|nr:retroviral-like aspartic protease family protein [Candidatus Woesearchaeota archaeon]